jgi:hypothetical protein
MSGPIQTIPQGLLGLLQLKQTGNNPRDLADVVNPVVDMRDFWFNRNVVDIGVVSFGTPTFTKALPTATPGQGQEFTTPSTIQVPSNQTWWLTKYEVHCTLLAAETIRFACSSWFKPANSVFRLGPDYQDTITARARYASCFANGFWALPGEILTFDVYDDLTAGNITVTGGVRGVIIPL